MKKATTTINSKFTIKLISKYVSLYMLDDGNFFSSIIKLPYQKLCNLLYYRMISGAVSFDNACCCCFAIYALLSLFKLLCFFFFFFELIFFPSQKLLFFIIMNQERFKHSYTYNQFLTNYINENGKLYSPKI